MHLLAGFIQLLLILSQSRYMPDMSAVWTPTPEPAVAVYTATPITTIHEPLSTVTYTVSCKDGCCNRRYEGELAPARQPARIFVISPSSTLPAGEAIPVHKLYLVFCQLKIGG